MMKLQLGGRQFKAGFSFFCAMMVFFKVSTAVAEEQTISSAKILHELRGFKQMGSVLYIAAHPDDENPEMVAYLANKQDYRTAYLSLTRGDGGQNVLGPDFGEKLGVARTQELLAARRMDNAQQFFSRAIDFGFSKDYRETLNIWNHQEVLSDIVRVIRIFRPDVLITRFSPIPGGTHGHHTASAVLALEAFKLAGDPKAFPEQLRELKPWQPTRIVWNGAGFEHDKFTGTNRINMDVGGRDPVNGEPLADIAGRSRSMHKTQGFGYYSSAGENAGPRNETFQLLGGLPMTNDIIDGVATTWNRVPGGNEIGILADAIISQFNPKYPAASIPALLQLRKELMALPAKDSVVTEKCAQLDRIIQACLGLEVRTTIAQSEVVRGEKMTLAHSAVIHSDISVRWVAVRYPKTNRDLSKEIELHPNQPNVRESIQKLPESTPLTQPYWLREDGTAGMFHVGDSTLIGTPENLPVFPIEHIFEVGGQTLMIPDEPVQFITNSANVEIRRRLDVIPPVSLHFASDIALLAPGTSQSVEVEITASRADETGTLQLETPANWKVSPVNQPFHLANVGDRAQFEFTLTAPLQSTTAKIIASAEIGGVRYRNQRQEISYSHIPRQLLQPTASFKAISLNLVTRGHTIGYLPGAGDSVADNLKQMGYTVKTLDDANLVPEQLHNLDAVVIGIRALNVRTNLVTQMPALLSYVENGGTVVAQYNRPDNNLKGKKIAPYDLQLSGDRVTDENATMTLLATNHPALNTPNKITEADFAGWVQERGVYFPNQWDEHFTPILACNDAGEAPKSGSLLIAQYGKGYFVYTGLAFFRQLPAGVPGAYRLFANLVSLGK